MGKVVLGEYGDWELDLRRRGVCAREKGGTYSFAFLFVYLCWQKVHCVA